MPDTSPRLQLPLTDEEIARLVSRGIRLDDGKVFLLEHPDLFLAHYFRDRLLPFEDFHLHLVWSMLVPLRALELFPAGHGKTTIGAGLVPIYELCRNPDHRGAVIMKTEGDAKDTCLAIRSEFEDNTELIEDYGPFRPTKGSPKRWTTTDLEIENRRLIHPRPSLEFHGSGGNVLGHRTDHVICDDVVTDKNSFTDETRAKLRTWFNLGVSTMPEDENDRITVIGTRFHPMDLYGDLIELRHPETDAPMYEVTQYDAIVDEELQQTLWPQRWTWEQLMAQKSTTGTLDFNRRYRNRAIDPERMIFREEYVRGGYVGVEKFPGCLDRHHTVGDASQCQRLYGGHDPASGVKKGHSWVGHVVIGVGSCEKHPERCWWVIDLERDTMTGPRQADFIIQQHLEYDLTCTMVESNGFQLGLNQFVKERLDRRGLALKIEPHHTGQNKIDPEVGVEALSPIVENGMLHIPWGDEHSRRKMRQLVLEMEEYPGRTYDTVMALWLAWRASVEGAPRYQSFNRLPSAGIVLNRRFVPWGQRYVANPYYETDIVTS